MHDPSWPIRTVSAVPAVPAAVHDAPAAPAEWSAREVRALRQFLRLTQDEFARRLGARQQTISEWEVGKHRPRGMSAITLTQLAASTGYMPAAQQPLPLAASRPRR
jgi:DNA-binding transcriptional regulator YiaG